MPLERLERCALVGMVHLQPLPGSPGWAGSIADVVSRARADAEVLVEGGVDAVIVENMGDVPYLKGHVPPETVAAMALATAEVADVGVPVGVQVLAAANREALGVAVAAGASFIRVEGFAYAHVADEGWIDACAGELLRVRQALGAKVAVWADVRKKHAAHAITGDLTLTELAKGAVFCGADALVVTGMATGMPTARADVIAARAAGRKVLVGSGVTESDAHELAEVADGLIVGSSLKENGTWWGPVELERVRRLRARVEEGPSIPWTTKEDVEGP